MTWLTTEGDSTDCDAVLGLQPTVYGAQRDLMDVAWGNTDPALLQLCRLQMAQAHKTRLEKAEPYEDHLAALEDWRSADSFTDKERAAFEYVEQFLIDQNGISNEQEQQLRRHLSEEELVAFVQAINLNDAFIRVLTLLDVGFDPTHAVPDPHEARAAVEAHAGQRGEQAEVDPEAPVNHNERLVNLTAPAFFDARATFAAVAMLETSVDDVTSELVRLRNANHQRCQLCMSVRRAQLLPTEPDESDPMEIVRVYEQSSLPESQKVLLRLTDAFLMHPGGFGEEARSDTLEHYTSGQIVEILLKLTYWSQNRTSIALGMDNAIDEDQLTAFDYNEGGDFVLLAGAGQQS